MWKWKSAIYILIKKNHHQAAFCCFNVNSIHLTFTFWYSHWNVPLTANVGSTRLLVYERVYLPLYKVADTLFHISCYLAAEKTWWKADTRCGSVCITCIKTVDTDVFVNSCAIMSALIDSHPFIWSNKIHSNIGSIKMGIFDPETSSKTKQWSLAWRPIFIFILGLVL